MSVFGRNIRKLREYMDWSIEKMSLETGIGVGMVSNYELGKSQPNLIVLTKFSEIFNMTIDELIKLEEFEIIEKYESKKGSSNNIISNSKGAKHNTQVQGGQNNGSESDASKDVVIESLKRENELLHSQLERANKTIDMLLEKK